MRQRRGGRTAAAGAGAWRRARRGTRGPRDGERGQGALLVAVALLVLMGAAALSVDVGRSLAVDFRLQNGADAAALAGSADLPADPAAAQDLASSYAAANGLPAPAVTISGPTIRVAVSATVPTVFARVLGVLHVPVAVAAAATATGVTCAGGACTPACLQASPCAGPGCAAVVTDGAAQCVGAAWGQFGLAPWDAGVTEVSQYVGPGGCAAAGDCPLTALKVGTQSNEGGNFLALAIGADGASQYEQNIVDGAAVAVHLGDWLSTETGEIQGPTCKGVAQFLADGAQYVVVPVTSDIEVSGRTAVQVLGFAAFQVVGCSQPTGTAEVTGRFVVASVPGLGGPGTTDTQDLFGLYGSGTLTPT